MQIYKKENASVNTVGFMVNTMAFRFEKQVIISFFVLKNMTAETIEINGLRITSRLQEILQYIGEDTDTYLNLIFHLEDMLLTIANDDLNTAFDCVEKLIYLSYFRNLVLALRVKGEE